MAVCNDCISYKVNNLLIMAGLFLGLAFQVSEHGIMGVIHWIAGAAVPVFSLWILFRYRMLGAGDIKLFSVIGGMYGALVILNTMILAFFAGGVLSVIRLVQTGGFKNRLQYLAGFISNQWNKKILTKYYQKERDGRAPVIHFTIAIVIGFVLCRFGYFSILS